MLQHPFGYINKDDKHSHTLTSAIKCYSLHYFFFTFVHTDDDDSGIFRHSVSLAKEYANSVPHKTVYAVALTHIHTANAH